jgi:GGDEF domain-containing protein
MARIAAAVFALIGAFGLLATVEPFKSQSAHTGTMRLVAGAAVLIAVTLPWAPARFRSTAALHALLVAMAASIAGVAYAGGAQHGDLTILFVFQVALASYFLPLRASALQAGLAGILLTSWLFLADSSASVPEAMRFAILVPALASVWALVALLRQSVAEREARLLQHDVHDPETGLLSPNGLRQTVESELARAVRHGRPLSVLLLEIIGPGVDGDEPGHRLVPAVSRAIIGRIRAEDKAARLGMLRFAVVAIETRGDGAAAFAHSLADQVRKRILGLGFESKSFTVRVGWADNLVEHNSPDHMLAEAERSLESTVPAADGIALPPFYSKPPPLAPRPDAADVAAV